MNQDQNAIVPEWVREKLNDKIRNTIRAYDIWKGSDGALTSRFYRDLQKHGPMGEIAVALFRANKCSSRAKVYRGGVKGVGTYRSLAYERKNWSVSELCKTLAQFAGDLNIIWGWRRDPDQTYHAWVIYVDLPGGQVSFHSRDRGIGPDYTRVWDGKRTATERICLFCDAVLAGSFRRDS